MSKRRNLSLPLPDPEVFNASNSFVKKHRLNCTSPKERKCPAAPKPSRSFCKRQIKFSTPTVISYNNSHKLSSLYNAALHDTYLQQCFDCVDKIGEGSFGEVFQVKSKLDGTMYAVKKFKDSLKFGRKTKLAEVFNTQKVPRNPFCVEFFLAWEEDDILFMQLEYCDTSLDKYTSENPDLGESELWGIFYDILMALKALHDHRFVHRDVKPDNIMRCRTGACKLGDFGLLFDLNEKENAKNDCEDGDSKYLAPEGLDGKSSISTALDIFSLGITMAELATTYLLPGNGPNWNALRNEKFPPYFQEQMSSDMFNVVTSMMRRDPADRPTVDQLLAMKPLQDISMQREYILNIEDGAFWNNLARAPIASSQETTTQESSEGKAASSANVPVVVVTSPQSASKPPADDAMGGVNSLLTSALSSESDDLSDFVPVRQSTPVSLFNPDNPTNCLKDMSKVRLSLFSNNNNNFDNNDDDDDDDDDNTQ